MDKDTLKTRRAAIALLREAVEEGATPREALAEVVKGLYQAYLRLDADYCNEHPDYDPECSDEEDPFLFCNVVKAAEKEIAEVISRKNILSCDDILQKMK
jgi:hypothetical protein